MVQIDTVSTIYKEVGDLLQKLTILQFVSLLSINTRSFKEAQVPFDPFTATSNQWKDFLVSSESAKVNYSEYPFKSALELVVEKVGASSVGIAARAVIATNAVEAVLAGWNSIIRMHNAKSVFDHDSHPLTFVPILARVDGRPDPELVKIVQRLWNEFPGKKSYVDRNVSKLIGALGAALPEDLDFLEMLYQQHFERYSMLALAIMFEREEYVLASKLFEANASRYGNFDPLALDYLVSKGLPAKVAKIWLDQSVNAKEGYEEHYSKALERWAGLEKK